MSTTRLLASAAFGACLTVAIVAGPAVATAAGSTTTPPTLPQVSTADAGATWLASQLTSGGFIPSATTPGTADLSSTANAVLALASAGVDLPGAQGALDYLETQVDTYVAADGSDGPGQLALLIFDAHALGVDPTSFGGADLVSRLLATQQTTGTDAGLFGTEAQVADYDAGVYNQGLALAALAAVGTTTGAPVTAAESWLEAQQCPDGGWTSYMSSTNPCNGDPASYEGPDTNSTALAIEGLSAQSALSSTSATGALGFLAASQDPDGGWGYEPNAADAPGMTDPDSTALVIQAILSMGQSPSATQFQQGASGPVGALLSFQLTSGTGSGAFYFPGSTDPNMLSTYEAVPAAAGVVFPFVASSTTAIVNPASTTAGVAVTYGAMVTSTAATPTGSVTFTTGTTTLCTTAALVNGAGSCSSIAAPVGRAQTITATYSGPSDFGLSNGTAQLTVAPVPVTSPGSSPTTTSPAVVGATSVHTGEPFAGSTPFVAALGGTGAALVIVGARTRRRTKAARARA